MDNTIPSSTKNKMLSPLNRKYFSTSQIPGYLIPGSLKSHAGDDNVFSTGLPQLNKPLCFSLSLPPMWETAHHDES